MIDAFLAFAEPFADPLLLLDSTGHILASNSAAHALFQIDVADRQIFSMVAEHPDAVREYLRLASGTRSAIPGSLTWKVFDTSIPTRCDAGLARRGDADQPPLLVMRCFRKHEALQQFHLLNDQVSKLGREIGERQKVEQTLRDSQQALRDNNDQLTEILESIGDGFAAIDEKWIYTYANSKAAEIADLKREDIVGKTVWESFPGRFGTAFSQQLRHAMAERVAVHFDDYYEPAKMWLEYDVYPAAHGLAMFYRDITDRKRFEQELRQTQKLESLGVLAGGVAHDFNNLLVGILGNATLALETLSSNNPARSLLRDVISASERAAHLTRQLLAYAGKGRFIIEPIDLSDLVREISNLIQTSIPKAVHLRLELQDKLPCIEADAAQLQQVIMNLVINGAEAIPNAVNGTVLVTTGVQDVDDDYIRTTFAPNQLNPGTYVSLEVHDSGVGMKPEIVSKIFDPFFTTKFTGRGLGLAATLGIVRGHKGAIKVYSTPGKGTTFKILFPATEDRPVKPMQTVIEDNSPSETVLVIDDEQIVRRTAKSMLERFGYTVVLAENGREGVDMFRILADKVSVVILDMTMPVLSGEDAFRELKAIRPDVQVILSSGYNEVEAIRRFTGKGLAGFVQKPYSAASLAEKIGAVLDERRGHERGTSGNY